MSGSDDPLPVVRSRLESVDLLRGLVMVVMVLDHVRDYLMDLRVEPTDLSVTTPALFFTRWVTHFCAPTFIFLAGVGAGLLGTTGKTSRGLSRYLLIRGIWLIVLEETLFSVFFLFARPQVILALVLWAIGWSMIALSVLIHLPRAVVGVIGVAMIAFHNLLDPIQVGGTGALSILWSVLHQPGFRILPGGVGFLVGYPLIPWIGVMASGYAFAPILLLKPERRRRIILSLGAAMVVGFLVLRGINRYGNPTIWEPQPNPVFTLMSFLNCQKYPPSLLFLMMTLGPALLALGWFDRGLGRLGQALLTFGRVPLFYYLLQWPLAHGLAVVVEALRGQPVGWLSGYPLTQAPPGYGQSLATTYLMWLVVVAILYYPSRWFANLKRRRRDAWLSYF